MNDASNAALLRSRNPNAAIQKKYKAAPARIIARHLPLYEYRTDISILKRK